MAGYTYGGYTTRFESHTCKNCGWKTSVHHSQAAPKVCKRCKHDPNTGEEIDLTKLFHNEHADKSVKLSTHVQIKWNCRSCGHFGVKWVNAKTLRKVGISCPNCEAENIPINKIPKQGRSKSLWLPTSTRVPKPKHNAYICGECGQVKSFRFMRPRRCENCGKEFPIDNAEAAS